MAPASKARKRALDLLFAAELRRESPVEALDRAIEEGEGPTNDYTATSSGASSSTRPGSTSCWRRTPRAGRSTGCRRSTATCCGIGVYEMLYVDDVPDAVAVTEAMALVRGPLHRRVPAFVNGVLGKILRRQDRAGVELTPRP